MLSFTCQLTRYLRFDKVFLLLVEVWQHWSFGDSIMKDLSVARGCLSNLNRIKPEHWTENTSTNQWIKQIIQPNLPTKPDNFTPTRTNSYYSTFISELVCFQIILPRRSADWQCYSYPGEGTWKEIFSFQFVFFFLSFLFLVNFLWGVWSSYPR